jgi:hypothetical protein
MEEYVLLTTNTYSTYVHDMRVRISYDDHKVTHIEKNNRPAAVKRHRAETEVWKRSTVVRACHRASEEPT